MNNKARVQSVDHKDAGDFVSFRIDDPDRKFGYRDVFMSNKELHQLLFLYERNRDYRIKHYPEQFYGKHEKIPAPLCLRVGDYEMPDDKLFLLRLESPESPVGFKDAFISREGFGQLVSLYFDYIEWLKQYEPSKIYGGVKDETTGQ